MGVNVAGGNEGRECVCGRGIVHAMRVMALRDGFIESEVPLQALPVAAIDSLAARFLAFGWMDRGFAAGDKAELKHSIFRDLASVAAEEIVGKRNCQGHPHIARVAELIYDALGQAVGIDPVTRRFRDLRPVRAPCCSFESCNIY